MSNEKKTKRARGVAHFLSAIATGIFVGMALGLSQSPLISAVMAALIPLVGISIFGVSLAKGSTSKIDSGLVSIVGVFFLTVTISMLAALHYRDSVGPLTKLHAELVSLGIPEEIASCSIINSVSTATIEPIRAGADGVLFSGEDKGGTATSLCMAGYLQRVSEERDTEVSCRAIAALTSASSVDRASVLPLVQALAVKADSWGLAYAVLGDVEEDRFQETFTLFNEAICD